MKLLKGNRSFNPLVLLPPAMCDMVATSVMYIGLTLTYASSFQMLRGVLIQDLQVSCACKMFSSQYIKM